MEYRETNRDRNLASRRKAMKVNGQSMKRLLVDRAAKAQGPQKDAVCRDHGKSCPNLRTLAHR